MILTKISKNTKLVLLLCVVLIAIFWIIRIPLFRQGWDGEDANGIDTDIVVKRPSYPNYYLLWRINGLEHYSLSSGHPGTIYGLFSLLGAGLKLFINWDSLSDQQIVTFLKIFVTTTQFLIYLAIGFVIIKKIKNWKMKIVGLVLLGVLANSPISIYNSNEFQIDSFWGVIMVSSLVFSLLLIINNLKIIPWWKYCLLFFTSAFLGLGKIEWSLMLIFSAIFILFIHIFVQKLLRKEKVDYIFLKFIIFILLGNLLGNLFNYLFHKKLYLDGVKLIVNMVNSASIATQSKKIIWMHVVYYRIPFIITSIFLIIIIFAFIWQNRKAINYYLLFLATFGCSLFFAFFFSSWGNFSRYFAPSLICLIIVFFLYYARKKTTIAINLIIMLMVLTSSYYSYKLLKQLNIQAQNQKPFIMPDNVENGCIPLIDVGYVYRSKIDFIHIHIGYEGAQLIADKYNKVVCKK